MTSLPYAVTFRGKPACPCLADWLVAYETELLRRDVIKSNIDIYQLIGGVIASGGTHARGGAFDIAQTSPEAIKVARQMGADATWHRPRGWDGANGISHTHGVLRGCLHNTPAAYQINAVDRGFNGLGSGGFGGKDTGPRPLSGLTWQQGILWAAQQRHEPNMAEIQKMEPENYFIGAKGDHVKWMAQRLIAHGVRQPYRNAKLELTPDRVFTEKEDFVAVKRFQRAQGWKGYKANGVPNLETLVLLTKEPPHRKRTKLNLLGK